MSALTPASAATADPNASPKTKAILNYLVGLPSKPDHRLISGQWRSWGSVSTGTHQTIYDMTGQWLGLVGADYYQYYNSNTAMRVNVPGVNPAMINYANLGALIQIDAVFLNPANGAPCTNTTISTANYDAITTPGTVPYNNYKAEMDKVAAGLQDLENRNVTVLFRTLMEMQGGWFWWSAGGSVRFKKLWIYTFNYLTYTKGLNNLLWVYAAYEPSTAGYRPGFYTAHYPGPQYVDIVGVDAYGYTSGKLSGYDELVATGKPFALTEFGQQNADWTVSEPGKDLNQAVLNIKASMPKTVYFMAWGGKWDVNRQLNVKTALTNPWVQNRPVPYGSATIAPAPIPSPAPAPAPAPAPTPSGTVTLAPPTITAPVNGALLSGTSATVAWSSVSGAAGYLLRCQDLTGATPLDTRNTWNGESFLYIDKYVGNSITLKVVTGHSYRFWIHSAKSSFAYADSTSWSAPAEVRFSMTAVSVGTGLTGQYFNNSDFTGTSIVRTDATVNFDWGLYGSPSSAIGTDTFSARWTGQVQPQYSQTYTFFVTGDDGVRLWVNGVLLIDKWLVQNATEYSGSIALTAGTKYNIKLEYYENFGYAVSQLRWSSANTPKAVIPSSRLYPILAPPTGTG